MDLEDVFGCRQALGEGLKQAGGKRTHSRHELPVSRRECSMQNFGFWDRNPLARASALSSQREGSLFGRLAAQVNEVASRGALLEKLYFGRNLLASASDKFSRREGFTFRGGYGASITSREPSAVSAGRE